MKILLISNVLGFYFGLTIVTALVFPLLSITLGILLFLQCFDDLVFKKYGIKNVYENDLDAVKYRFFYVQDREQRSQYYSVYHDNIPQYC